MEINLYKLKPTRKGLLTCLGVLIVLAIPIVYMVHQYNDPNSSLYKEASFQLYAPNELPPGVKVTDKFLVAEMPGIHRVWYPWFIWLKPLDMDFIEKISQNPNEGITEWKVESRDSPLAAIDCKEGNKTFDSCETRKTAHGQQYEYLRDQDIVFGAMPGHEEVVFIKGHTLISVGIYIKNNTPITQSEWDDFIDSFAPINANSVPFGHTSPVVSPI